MHQSDLAKVAAAGNGVDAVKAVIDALAANQTITRDTAAVIQSALEHDRAALEGALHEASEPKGSPPSPTTVRQAPLRRRTPPEAA